MGSIFRLPTPVNTLDHRRQSKPCQAQRRRSESCQPNSSVLSSAGVLTITGTNGADNLQFVRTSNRISLKGFATTWAAASVKSIVVYLQAGADRVSLDSLANGGNQALGIAVTVNSGMGNENVKLANGKEVTLHGTGEQADQWPPPAPAVRSTARPSLGAPPRRLRLPPRLPPTGSMPTSPMPRSARSASRSMPMAALIATTSSPSSAAPKTTPRSTPPSWPTCGRSSLTPPSSPASITSACSPATSSMRRAPIAFIKARRSATWPPAPPTSSSTNSSTSGSSASTGPSRPAPIAKSPARCSSTAPSTATSTRAPPATVISSPRWAKLP